ncbi:hypothetical protein SAMN05428949_0724 [Chitinophaga sp. YR627]|nr:hypothetical protein SAMN05428949_0724 [Chitinophaga sp. YR627]
MNKYNGGFFFDDTCLRIELICILKEASLTGISHGFINTNSIRACKPACCASADKQDNRVNNTQASCKVDRIESWEKPVKENKPDRGVWV